MTGGRPLLVAGALLLAVALVAAGCKSKKSSAPATTAATSTSAQTAPVKQGTRPRSSTGPVEAGIQTPRPYAIGIWNPSTNNVYPAKGTVTVDGVPVDGATVAVGGYPIPAPTGADGSFVYPLDSTVPARKEVKVVGVSNATVDGYRLSPAETQAVEGATGWIDASYALTDVRTERRGDGTVAITGRIGFKTGAPPPPVVLTSYRLEGTVRSADGKPVQGAIVSVRATDRNVWSFSTPSDAKGRYVAGFNASDQLGSNPVPMTLRISIGDRGIVYLPEEYVLFSRLKSARLDVNLPPERYAPALPQPVAVPGAVYQGVLVGAIVDGESVRPVEARWPDANGRFELVLPASASGKTASLWVGPLELFSRDPATPGGAVDLASWPKALPADVPRGILSLRLS